MTNTGFAERIPPLAVEELSERQANALGDWKDMTFTRVLMRNPRMLNAFVPYLTTMVAKTNLPQRDRQIVCMYMLELCGDVYEKTHHINISKKVGLTDEEISAMLNGGGDCLTDWDRVIIKTVEELYRDQYVTDETWAKLGEKYTQHQQMEIVFLCGCYHTMAMLTKSFGIPLEPDLEEFNKLRKYAE